MEAQTKTRLVFCAFACVALLAAPGCNSRSGEVSGTVRFKGVPLTGGQVTFTSAKNNGESAFAWIGEDGSYVINRCPTGPVKITVLALQRNRFGKDEEKETKAASGKRRNLPALPSRYTDPNVTDLEFVVVTGTQQFDIDLKP